MARFASLQRIRDDGIDLTSFDKFPRQPKDINWQRAVDIVFLVSFLCLTLWVLYRIIWR